MYTWYAVYISECIWYASSQSKATAERWVKELVSKGYSATIDVIRTPYSE